MSSARSADLFSAHFLLISCIHIILAGEYALLEKLIVAVFTELPLSLNVIFSLGDRRVFRNVGQTPAQDAALHLLSSGAACFRAPVALFAHVDIVCHTRPHFSICVGAGEGEIILIRLQNTVTRVLPPLVQV